MVSSKESFTTLNLIGGPTIYMGDESQIPATGRGSIKIQHDEFKNVLYVPSLATNLLYVYQMTHTSSPKRVTFKIKSIRTYNGGEYIKIYFQHYCESKGTQMEHSVPYTPQHNGC